MLLFTRSVLKIGLLAFLACSSLRAEVTLPAIFGDHMVLQQGCPLPIWGKAVPGESVLVTLGHQSAETVAAADGRWRVMLRPLSSSPDSMELVVQGKNRIEISDVLIGDVWLCAGEGNMDYPLADAVGGKEDPGNEGDRYLRFFMADKTSSEKPDHLGSGVWVVCTEDSAEAFSAVGYFFARDLRNARQRPIGMIQCTWKNSPIQSWISHQGLAAAPSFQHDPVKSPSGIVNQKTPSALYNGMISPLIPYAITGTIWYQGESNEGLDALEYRRLFPRLIRDWRKQWNTGPLPFYFVSPAGFGDEEGSSVEEFLLENQKPSRAIPWLREAVAGALTLPNTGMAVATDLGLPDELYPPDKLDVGRRLALLARRRVYGEEVVDSGPVFESMHGEGAKIRVKFKVIGSTLTLGLSPFQPEDASPMTVAHLTGFAVSGKDGKWFPAKGAIDSDTVLLSSDAVPHPVAVRYNWGGFPKGNLYNKEGLPAAPFRTDTNQPVNFSN